MAFKSVAQRYSPSQSMLSLMESFRQMTNACIETGLKNNAQSLGKLSKLCYTGLAKYGTLSYYRLTAMSKAAGILSARAKSIKRGKHTKSPYVRKPCLVSCYGFSIVDGVLRIPLGDRRFEEIPLNRHVLDVLSEPGLKVRSFALNANTLSICFAKETDLRECTSTLGIDRNVGNVTCGNNEDATIHDLTYLADIQQSTKEIIASFRRNDVRIMGRIASKYGRRKRNRTRQFIHAVTNSIVADADRQDVAIVLEDIRDIKQKLFRRGDGKGRRARGLVNGVPWAGEIERQITYKAAWEGIPVIVLSRKDTMGTSSRHWRCGERLQFSARDGWCARCGERIDRDVNAAINISKNGRTRLVRSKGPPAEAMKGNPEEERMIPAIHGADGGKHRISFGDG